MEFIDLIDYAQRMAKKHPKLKSEIRELLHMAKDEIEAGESIENECHLAERDIKELVENL